MIRHWWRLGRLRRPICKTQGHMDAWKKVLMKIFEHPETFCIVMQSWPEFCRGAGLWGSDCCYKNRCLLHNVIGSTDEKSCFLEHAFCSMSLSTPNFRSFSSHRVLRMSTCVSWEGLRCWIELNGQCFLQVRQHVLYSSDLYSDFGMQPWCEYIRAGLFGFKIT